jgi:hypothetical protein
MSVEIFGRPNQGLAGFNDPEGKKNAKQRR